jgi:hypothetical protein
MKRTILLHHLLKTNISSGYRNLVKNFQLAQYDSRMQIERSLFEFGCKHF